MSKKRTSLSLDPEVADYLQQDRVNASGLVNNLVKQYMEGADQKAMQELRKRQLREEYESLVDRARRKYERYEQLDETIPSEEEERQSRLEEAAKRVATTETNTFGTTIADGDQLKQVARNYNVDPDELRKEVLPDDG